MNLMDETSIPADLLPKARQWFDRQMVMLEKAHGDKWLAHREWLADYLNAELRERANKLGRGVE